MTQPTKESLDRAREYLMAIIESRPLVLHPGESVTDVKILRRHVDSLVDEFALLLDRVRLEGKVDGIKEIERHKWTAKGKFMSNTDWLHEWQSELAILSANAGEGKR